MTQIYFEISKIIVSTLIPIIVVIVGWKINRRLKEIEYGNWRNQKLIEKRLILYDDIAPKLNDLYCFYCFVGNWKEISPLQIIEIKRYLDKKVHTYRSILGNDLFSKYNTFMSVAFITYTGEGEDAKINTVIRGYNGNRAMHCKYEWSQSWENLFPKEACFDKMSFMKAYDNVLTAFQDSIGILPNKKAGRPVRSGIS